MPWLPILIIGRLSERITWKCFLEILSILTVHAPDDSCYVRRDLWFWDTAVGILKEEYIEVQPYSSLVSTTGTANKAAKNGRR